MSWPGLAPSSGGNETASWDCDDPWELLTSWAFWLWHMGSLVLCPPATLLNLFLLHILRKDFAIPPSLRPIFAIFALGMGLGLLAVAYGLAGSLPASNSAQPLPPSHPPQRLCHPALASPYLRHLCTGYGIGPFGCGIWARWFSARQQLCATSSSFTSSAETLPSRPRFALSSPSLHWVWDWTFWLWHMGSLVLCPPATLLNLFLLHILRRDFAIPPSLRPTFAMFAVCTGYGIGPFGCGIWARWFSARQQLCSTSSSFTSSAETLPCRPRFALSSPSLHWVWDWAFWLWHMGSLVLCPPATLLNLFLLHILRRDFAIPPSLRPIFAIFALGMGLGLLAVAYGLAGSLPASNSAQPLPPSHPPQRLCHLPSLRPIFAIFALGGASVSSYLLARVVYTFASIFLSECPLLGHRNKCLLQESVVLLYLSFTATAALLLGFQRLLLAVLSFFPLQTSTRSGRQQKIQRSLRRLGATVGVPLAVGLSGAGLAWSFFSLSWLEGGKADWAGLELTCSLLEVLRFPTPLCFSLTILFLYLTGLGLLALSARFPLWVGVFLRHPPDSYSQEHEDVLLLNSQLLTSFSALLGLHCLSLLANAVQILSFRIQTGPGPSKGALIYQTLFREALFYVPIPLAAFLFPVALLWKVRSLKRLLLLTLPCLRLEIRLRVVEDTDLDLASLHSVPDDLSRSTSHDPHGALTSLTAL